MDLLRIGKNTNEICNRLNISRDELYRELRDLKSKGFVFGGKYYSDGSIKYQSFRFDSAEVLHQAQQSKERTLITDAGENNISFLLISDLHFGNELQRIDLINRCFDYCVKKGIHIVLCSVDLVDGSFSFGNQLIKELHKQMEFFIKNYPRDDSILTFGVLGDHDISLLAKGSLNLVTLCENYRPDIILGETGRLNLNLKNDYIYLCHQSYVPDDFKSGMGAPIILKGHSHRAGTIVKPNGIIINVPALSDINQLMPSALVLEVAFDEKTGFMNEAKIKQKVFCGGDIITANITTLVTLKERRLPLFKGISNVESYLGASSNARVLKPVSGLSQTDKFNKRYGLK